MTVLDGTLEMVTVENTIIYRPITPTLVSVCDLLAFENDSALGSPTHLPISLGLGGWIIDTLLQFPSQYQGPASNPDGLGWPSELLFHTSSDTATNNDRLGCSKTNRFTRKRMSWYDGTAGDIGRC
jgi:hypothetical protein